MQAQPYRKGAREPGPALDAMKRGRTLQGYNPKDAERDVTSSGGGRRAFREPRKLRDPRQFR